MEGVKVGLALGSGAFKGLAHIGVLQVLAEEGVDVACIAGSSMGAVIGSIYCAGVDPFVMQRIVEQLDERLLYDPALPRGGIMAGHKAEEAIRTLTRNKNINELNMPFAAVACDIESGQRVVLSHGKAWEAVRASMAVPGVFRPYVIDGRKLVDGGLVDRVPMDTARALGADVVVAVDVGYRGDTSPVVRTRDVLLRSLDILQWEIMRLRVHYDNTADVWVTPKLDFMNPWLMKHRDEAILAGQEAMREMMPELRAAIAAASSSK